MLTELARNPRPYFAERVKYPRLRRQAIIVVIAGMVAHVWKLTAVNTLGAASDYIVDILIILWFAGVMEFVIAWLVLTGIMQIVSGLLGGDTSYGRLLRLTGYGFTPLIISGAIWSIGHHIALLGAGPPDPPTRQSFRYGYESYSEYVAQVSGDLVIFGSVVVGSIFVLAAGYLWYQGVSVASELEDRGAAITAGVAVAAYLGYVYYTMV